MPLSSNFLRSLLVKNCENWSTFSEDMVKCNSLLFWPPCIFDVFYVDDEIWGTLVQ